MCGRYSLHHTTQEVVERFKAQLLPFELEQRFNVAPSQAVAVVTERAPHEDNPDVERNLEVFKWGLVPFWVKDLRTYKPLINARSETLIEKNSFKNALARRRCLVLSDGFFEWKKTQTKRRIPMHIRLKSGTLFAFAGIWEVWKNADGERLKTCAIITVPANDLIADVHDRMPAILQPEDEDKWLNPEETNLEYLCSLLKPYPSEEMEVYPVSTIVNSPAIDSEECIVYADPEQIPEPVPISRRRGALIVAEKVEPMDPLDPASGRAPKKSRTRRNKDELQSMVQAPSTAGAGPQSAVNAQSTVDAQSAVDPQYTVDERSVAEAQSTVESKAIEASRQTVKSKSTLKSSKKKADDEFGAQQLKLNLDNSHQL